MTEFAGSLRERIGLERWQGVRDDSGGEAGAWVDAGSAWAAVADAGAPPGVEAERRTARARRRVLLRDGTGVDLTWRLRWRGRCHAVLGVRRLADRTDRVELLIEERD